MPNRTVFSNFISEISNFNSAALAFYFYFERIKTQLAWVWQKNADADHRHGAVPTQSEQRDREEMIRHMAGLPSDTWPGSHLTYQLIIASLIALMGEVYAEPRNRSKTLVK